MIAGVWSWLSLSKCRRNRTILRSLSEIQDVESSANERLNKIRQSVGKGRNKRRSGLILARVVLRTSVFARALLGCAFQLNLAQMFPGGGFPFSTESRD